MTILDPLDAGEFRVRATLDAPARLNLGGARLRRLLLAEGESPWGPVAVFAEGGPFAVTAMIGGEEVVSLVPTIAATPRTGPVAVDAEPPPLLHWAGGEAAVTFVAEGSRLRGGRRYVRAAGMSSWTLRIDGFGRKAHHAIGRRPLPEAPNLRLRRGLEPKDDAVVSIDLEANDKDGRIFWDDGATRLEVGLALVLWLGTDEVRLWPLWARALEFALSGPADPGD